MGVALLEAGEGDGEGVGEEKGGGAFGGRCLGVPG